MTDSGLRGRGGAAFPTGIKWRTVLNAPATPAAQKYIVCNADEGDSGTFSDRMLMEGDPFCLIEGMTIAGLAVGATRGYIYLRCEYPHAHAALAVGDRHRLRARATSAPTCWAAARPSSSKCGLGAGAYICGEETSLLESLEGKRGQVRFKPPLPAIAGLFGSPTVINNVITFASVPIILERGAAYYRDFGMGRSRGTLPIQLAGNIERGGLVEKAFGVTLRELLYDFGGGTRSGRPIRAVQVGGPLGAYWPESQFDTPLDYEAFAQAGGMLGHGGIVVFDDTVDMAAQARYAMEFCAIESCGKCTPCRIGSTRGVEVIDRMRAGDRPAIQATLLRDLCDTLTARLAVRARRPDAVPGAVRARSLSRRLRQTRGCGGSRKITLCNPLPNRIWAPPREPRTNRSRCASTAAKSSAGRHLGDARGGARGSQDSEAVRHRSARGLWLLPPVPGADRGHEGLSRLVHHAGGRGHEGHDAKRRSWRNCAAASWSSTSPIIRSTA